MRVLILGRFRQKSANGVDRTIEGHLCQLVKRGHSVVLLTFEKPTDEGLAELNALGVEVRLLPAAIAPVIMALRKFRGEFDLLCLHSVFTYWNWIAFSILDCRWITTPNGGYSPGQIAHKRPFLKKLAIALFERRMLEKALCVHALSATEAGHVKRVAPNSRIVEAPNGFEKAAAEALPWPAQGDPLRLLFIGRLAWMHKGLDLLLEALHRCGPGREWRLDIVGPGVDDERTHLEHLSHRLGIGSRVIFHGPRYGEAKRAFLADCHVFVHTSRWEGMPFAVVEALSAGRPVLVTPGTNMGDLVAQYDAGWVAEERGIAGALEQVMVTPLEDFSQKGANARRLASECLDWDRIGGLLFGEVEKLAASSERSV